MYIVVDCWIALNRVVTSKDTVLLICLNQRSGVKRIPQHFMVRIASQANAHQRKATSESQENSRKILKTRQKAMLDIPAKPQTTVNTSQTTISTTVLSCNCRKYCPAVNSTKLEVSYRRLFSYMLMREVVY